MTLFALNTLFMLSILDNDKYLGRPLVETPLSIPENIAIKKSPLFLWTDNSGSIQFIERDDGTWVENERGKDRFSYIKKSATSDSVELFDTTRGYTVVLQKFDSLLKPRTGNFESLYGGYWLSFAGKAIDPPSTGNYDQMKPPPPYIQGKREEQTIAVMFASYQDPLCGNSVFEAFKYAEYPERISAIVVQQNAENDVDCLEDYCDLATADGLPCFRDRVMVDRVNLDYARGVMPARYRQHLLIEDQEFCLQGDSHSAFENKWDTIAIEDWLLTENEMAVITTYPNRANDRHDQRNSPVRCSTMWVGKVVGGGNSAHNVPIGKAPLLGPFFGAGTSFSKCHANLNVPYDPYMSHLFKGEEFNRAIRLFTSGYDMYGPRRNFLYHYYDDDKKPPKRTKPRIRGFFSSRSKYQKKMTQQTEARWISILGLDPTLSVSAAAMRDAEYFGVGDRRSTAQYEVFSGVNLRDRKAESRCNLLGKMKWVPYEFPADTFYPSGNTCRFRLSKDIRRYCCTSLEKVRKTTTEFLALTNDEAGALLEVDKDYSAPSSPIISSSNTIALSQC